MSNELSRKIIIRFAMTKGDGELPEVSDLTSDEIRNMASICTFFLEVDHDELEEINKDLKIEKCQVIYDGVTHAPSVDQGYVVDCVNDIILGHPSPIIIFYLNLEVDPDEFRRTVWTSFVNVQPSSLDDEDECFVAEDHNGYCDVLTESQLQEYIPLLKEDGAYSEAVYSVEQLQGGILCSSIPKCN